MGIKLIRAVYRELIYQKVINLVTILRSASNLRTFDKKQIMETVEQKECQEPLELINFVKKEGLSHQVINNIVILYVPNSISDFSFILFYDRYKFKYPMSPKDALKVLKCETFHIETELIRFIYVNEIEQKDIINTNSLSLVDRNRNYISYLFFYSKF